MTKRKKKWILAGILILVLALTGAVGYFVGRPMVQLASNPEAFRAWVDGKGAWGQLLFVGMVILQVIIALIPGEPLEIGAGYAFGAWEGTLLCLVGSTIGGLLVFLLVRKWGMKVVELFFSREKIESLRFIQNSKKLKPIAFFLMFLPGTPKDLISYFMGLTKLKFSEWALISTIARIPSIVTSTVGGSALGVQNYKFAVFVFAGTLLISLGGWFLYNRYTKRHQTAHPAVKPQPKQQQNG